MFLNYKLCACFAYPTFSDENYQSIFETGIILHPSNSSEAVMRLDYLTLLKSIPHNLPGWVRPDFGCDR